LKYRYVDSLAALNKAWGTDYKDNFFADVTFPFERPSQAVQAKDYDDFLKQRYPKLWITVTKGSTPAYVAYLKKLYKSVTDFNVAAGTHAASWAEVKFPDTAPQMAEMKLWSDYVTPCPSTRGSWITVS